MLTSRNLLVGVAVVLAVGAGILLIQGSNKGGSQPQNSQQSIAAKPGQIVITAQGFEPVTTRIKVGEKVTFVNNDKAAHQVNSWPHPQHTDYPPLNDIGTIDPGKQKSINFPKAGTYVYHDHLNPSNRGDIVVQ